MSCTKPATLTQPILLSALAAFLNEFLTVDQYTDDQNGIYRDSSRPIRRLGLALEPAPDLANWTIANCLDALFLHRPWMLQPDQLPPEVGILAYHLAFDEQLTLGYNSRLASALGLRHLEELGHKDNRAIGMIGNLTSQPFEDYSDRVRSIFGGCEEVLPFAGTVSRVAVVGAMNDPLIRAAAAQGAQLYLTGQLRQPALAAVSDTGIGVAAIGHRRTEQWGLRALAGVLQERWAALEVILHPS